MTRSVLRLPGPQDPLGRLGARIRARRISRKMGQRELARLLGCSVGYVSLLERGLRDPSYTTFVSIACALGIPLDELTQGD